MSAQPRTVRSATASVPATVASPAAHRSVRRGRAQQPGRAVLQQGVVRGGGRGVHRARSSSTRRCRSRSATSRSRTSTPATTTRRVVGAARAAARAGRTTARRAGSSAARTRCSARSTDAVAEFTELLRYHPDDVGALVQLGLAEKDSGDLETRAALVSSARSRSIPTSAVVHFYVGEVLYNRGLNDDALAALRAPSSSRPTIPTRYYLLGFVLGDMGRHEEAQQGDAARDSAESGAVARAREPVARPSTPQRDEAWSRARGARDGSRDGGARRGAARALQPRARVPAEGLLRARRCASTALALERGEDRDARAPGDGRGAPARRRSRRPRRSCTTSCSSTQPDSPKLWNERGVALHQDGRFADAAESYRRAVACEPQYALALNNLGVALYHAGNAEASVEAFRFALNAQPTFVKARLNLALLLFKEKRLPLCLEAYRAGAAAGARAAGRVERRRARARRSCEKLEDARNAFARAIQARPDYAEAHYNLSFVLSNLGDFEGALRETKRALEIDPYYVAAEVRARDRSRVRGSRLHDRARISAASGAPMARVEEFAFDAARARLAVHGARAGRAGADAAATPTRPTPYAAAADYLVEGAARSRGGRGRVARSRAAAIAVEGLTLLGDVFAEAGRVRRGARALSRGARRLRRNALARRAIAGEVRVLHHARSRRGGAAARRGAAERARRTTSRC